jgi:hypothetical protein
MVWIGLISFPLYLWHWPILSFAQILFDKVPSHLIRILLVVISFLLAWLTYEYLEKRVRQNFNLIKQIIFFTLSLLLCSVLISFGLLTPKNNDHLVAKAFEASKEWGFPGDLKKNKFEGVDFYVAEGGPDITLMFGDSHMEHYAPRVLELSSKNNLNTTYFFTAGGCLPIDRVYIDRHDGGCSKVRNAMQLMLNKPEIKRVVFSNFWNYYFLTQVFEKKEAQMGGDLFFRDINSKREVNFRGGEGKVLALQYFEKYLRELSLEKEVFWILDSPSGKLFDPKFYVSGSRFSSTRSMGGLNNQAPQDKDQLKLIFELTEIALRANVKIIKPSDSLCINGLCSILDENNNFIYKDNHHLRPSYVKERATFIDQTVLVAN